MNNRIRCETCLFRAEKPLLFKGGAVKRYPCQFDPPKMLGRPNNETLKLETIPFRPLVSPDQWCSHWVDRDTKETLETVEGIR